MRYLIQFLLLLVSTISFGQAKQLETALTKGEDKSVIKLSETLLIKATDKKDSLLIYKFLNEAYLNLNFHPEYLQGIKKARVLETNKKRGDIYYYIELANYYHHKMLADSAIFFTRKSIQLLRKNRHLANPHLMYSVYSKFGNINRNSGVKNHNADIIPFEAHKRSIVLNKYLDTALIYTRSIYEKTDVYHKKAMMYLDFVANYKWKQDYRLDTINKFRYNAFLTSIKYCTWIMNNTHNKDKTAIAYSLMGLNHHYLNRYEEADNYYQKSLDALAVNDSIIHLYSYITTLNWKGWNLGEWYKVSNNINLLDKSIDDYRQNTNYWNTYYNRNLDKKKGINDGYRINGISKLSINLAKKFLVTDDSIYLTESFKYSDYSKYPNFNNLEFSIKDLQSNLKENEVFIQNVTNTRPYEELIFIIDKYEIIVILNDNNIVNMPHYLQNELYQFDDIKLFKNWSFKMYNSKFKPIDKILETKGITNVIVSNSDYNAMLNYDLMITDTLSSNWKTQPYLFHKYNFSYALCVRSFIESRHENKSLPTRLGITIGDFENDVNLRFSKKLIKGLENKYYSQTADATYNLKNNNIATIVSHGSSSYANKNGELRTAFNNIYSVDDIFGMELFNDFVIITTCNSNASQTNYSEGASGNFSKALRYAGAKSTLTTSWDIDDKSNAFIMEKFFKYLADGKPKSNALWKAKKDYWNQASQDEFKPLYWSPYILTGDIRPVIIRKKDKYKWAWLGFFLIIPLGYVFWKKTNNKLNY